MKTFPEILNKISDEQVPEELVVAMKKQYKIKGDSVTWKTVLAYLLLSKALAPNPDKDAVKSVTDILGRFGKENLNDRVQEKLRGILEDLYKKLAAEIKDSKIQEKIKDAISDCYENGG